MVKRSIAADGALVLAGEACVARLERLKPGILLGTIVGKGSAELDLEVMAELEREIQKHGSIKLYFDGRGQARLASETKDAAVAWGKKYKGRIDAQLLVESKLLEMALRVIGMFVGMPIQLHSSEKAFIVAVRQDVPDFRELPRVTLRDSSTATG